MEESFKRQNELFKSIIFKSDWFNADIESNLKRILEIFSELIQTERVSVWKYSSDYSKITCLDLYERSKKKHGSGEELVCADFPGYAAAHFNGKPIKADDVYTDPRTSDIPPWYYKKHCITSLLDVPVYAGGKLTALLSFEHTGGKRKWSDEDERLSLSMATHVALCFEIEERNHLEKTLRDNEAKYRTVFEGSSDGFFIMTDKFLDCNEMTCNIFGYTKDEMIGLSPLNFSPFFQPDGRSSEDAARNYIKMAMNGTPQRFYWVHQKKDGTLIDTEVSLTSLNIVNQNLIFAIVRDITENRRAEEALRRAEAKYRNIFENAVEGIFQLTPGGRLLVANPALARICGYNKPEELINEIKDFSNQVYDDPEGLVQLNERIRKDKFVRNFEIKARRKDGTVFWMSINVNAVQDNEGRIIHLEGMLEDITQRKKLEDQLRQSQKMEAIGTLAGGVAHDFNNILTVIMGYTHLMYLCVKNDDLIYPYINEINSAAEKAKKLTSNLLAFSRKQMISLSPIKINELIRNFSKTFFRIIDEDVELKTFLAEDDFTILADSDQIEQVLLNLATNARDAMPDGGLLIIQTEFVEIDDEYIKTHGNGKKGNYVLLSFTDFGKGMDDSTKEKVFEPFFTTKQKGKGTGLGLSMVYGIIKQHGGYINVYSELNRGTSFKIYLPLAPDVLVPAKSAVINSTAVITGTETVLLAEDDENVRKLTKYFLERYGYRVIEAIDGEDACIKFASNLDNIDILLFDVIMPKMNGKVAYEEIRKIKPEIPVIFISGYTANVIHQKGILEEGINLVLKPVSPTILLEKIRQVLSLK